MKKYLFILATAAIVAGCTKNDSFQEIDTPDNAIGFSTYAGKQTRAENSSATEKDNLEDYNTTFKVWGYKYVNGNESPVMGAVEDNSTYTYPGQLVEHKDDDASATPAVTEGWYYTPIRFWDKSATSYSFYAVSPNAPTDASWVWDNTNKKVSIANFAITGYNSVTTPATSVDVDKVLTENLTTEDLMIATDVTDYKTYDNTPVLLDFNHILSRLNIGVRKASTLDDFEVKLNSIKVYNMKSNGSFDEALASGTTLSNGTIARWATAPTTQTKFTTGVGYAPATALTITSTATTTSTNYQYVYEGLAIPQSVAYNQTVEVKDYDATSTAPKHFKLDGTNADASSDPYIVIDYEIWTTGTNAAKMDGYVYYYNLADVFNGDNSTDAINFCEGWQNTLNITLAPAAIIFDADVYEWTTKTETAVDIK